MEFINKLAFDFYLPKYNTCLEFDGIQHFEPVALFGGEKGLESTKIRDEIKNQWCLANNIKLIIINYKEDLLTKLKSIGQ